MSPVGLTFSCLKCLSSFNSLYVLLLNTGVEKGFIIFLMATDVLDSWSFAELPYQYPMPFTHQLHLAQCRRCTSCMLA